MRALVVRKLGNPVPSSTEKVPYQVVEDHPTQQVLPANAVRIKVAAAGLNFADALQVQGLYQVKPPLPFIPGAEVSGEVLEAGRDVRTLSVGEQVCAVTQNGGFASEIVVRESAVVKLPPHSDVAAAAGLPVAFGTAHLALKERANLKAGQTVLILGAGGGVGIAAVQIAKILGAKVIAVARGAKKAEVLYQLGADVVIDTSGPGIVERSSTEYNAPKGLSNLLVSAAGVDVVFDTVGGTAFAESLKVVKWGAHILIIGFASGSIPKIAANIALVKNLTVHGIFWGSHQMYEPRIFRRTLEESVQWLGQGKLQVPVSHRFPLEQASQAFSALLTRESVGKVLLLPNAPASKL
eukprot:jgi/Astpho2/6485/e_gw1.00096.22.1_t